jgi:pimeloyl-ACP methyl ester carboxylesterase
MKWRRILLGTWSWRRPLYSIAFIYAALAVFACNFADKLIFLPPRPGYDADLQDLVRLDTRAGESVAAVHLPAAGDRPTLLYSHGNAEDIGGVLRLLLPWHRNGFGILAYDYPGYGHSTGKPTEASSERAVEAAWNHLTKTAGVPAEKIVIVGRSVGCGPAVWLASREQSAGLVLISPFTSIYRLRPPARILPGDRFPNIDRIPDIDTPLLIVHGARDRIIPAKHGRQLFDAHPGPDKKIFEVPAAAHNDLFAVGGNQLELEILRFADRVAKDVP